MGSLNIGTHTHRREYYAEAEAWEGSRALNKEAGLSQTVRESTRVVTIESRDLRRL